MRDVSRQFPLSNISISLTLIYVYILYLHRHPIIKFYVKVQNRNQVERSACGNRVMQAILCIFTRLCQSVHLSLGLSQCLSVCPYVLKIFASIGTDGQFLNHCPILGKLIPLPSLSSQTQRVFGLVSRHFLLSTILFFNL